MKLYILYYGLSILRCLYILYLIRIRKSTGEQSLFFKAFRDGLLIITCVLMHWYRLSHEGRVCSGDFLRPNEIPRDNMLLRRGQLLYIHLLLIWLVVLSMLVVLVTYRLLSHK